METATYRTYLLPSFIILVFLLDILNKFPLFQDAEQIWYYLIKGGKFLFEFLFFLELIRTYKGKSLYLLIGFLAVLFLLGNFILLLNESNPSYLDFNSVRLFLLYLFPIIYLQYLKSGPLEIVSVQNRVEKLLLGIIIIYVLFIFIGFIGSIDFFKTYGKYRWGFMGLLPRSITASYFIIGALIFLYYKRNKGRLFQVLLISVIGAGILAGTKSIYLFFFLFSVYIILEKRIYKRKTFIMAAGSLLIGSIIFWGKIWEYLFGDLFSIFHRIYENKGLLTAIMSYRDEIFISNVQVLEEKWTVLNLFVGGKAQNSLLFENSVMDLVNFFGILGTAAYMFWFWKQLYRNSSSYIKTNLILVFIISILAGQLFANISAVTFLWLFFNFVATNERMKRGETE